jgi:hypothetical protein
LKSGKGRCTCEAKRLKLFVWLSAPGLPAPAVLFFALGLLHIDSSMANNLLSLHKTTPKNDSCSATKLLFAFPENVGIISIRFDLVAPLFVTLKAFLSSSKPLCGARQTDHALGQLIIKPWAISGCSMHSHLA